MALLATTAAVATAAALDVTLGFTTDIQQMRRDRQFNAKLNQMIEQLEDRVTLYHLLELADQTAEALWFEGKSWNYRALKLEVDRLAYEIHALGVSCGDLVAVYMSNSPEMVFVIYALSKLGAAPALINSALRDATLLHCVKLARSTQIICTPDLAKFASSAMKSLPEALQCLSFNLGSFPKLVEPGLEVMELVSPDVSESQYSSIPQPSRAISDIAALIYTSGTTGKPKACNIKNSMVCVTGCPTSADVNDPKRYLPVRTYGCMPLFHGTTFFTGLCYSVGTSGAFCLTRKFSASRFWREVTESRATRMLYVGELCRYLCASAPTKFDRAHKCIVATGNGLQKDIWASFKKRFGVPEIREYYRSTEGLARYDNRNRGSFGAGKIGYAGLIKRNIEDDVFIVKFDYENERPLRNEKGFCVLASLGEPGEAIGRIRNLATYTDYLANPEATEAKIMRDVFQKGDMFQRSGDLVVQERLGWVRFHDRIGETFRWKGENVSAGEVSGYICELDHVHDVIVVGKKLTGYDGQAGVAAITLKSSSPEIEKQFVEALYSNLKKKGIPAYAFPRLVSVGNEISVSATFKHAKQDLKTKNWSPDSNENDHKYWLDGNMYKPLQKSSWSTIEAGKAKL